MVKIISADNVNDLYRKILWGFVEDGELFKNDGSDYFAMYTADSGRAWVNDLELQIQNPLSQQLNLNLSGYHFPQRWNKFFYEYTQAEPFAEFLNQSKFLQPFQVSGYTCATRSHHNLGNCLFGVSYRPPGGKQKAKLVLFSRSSLYAPTAVLDFGFGLAILQWIYENTRQRLKPENITFAWRCSQVQIMSWKMLLPLRFFGLIKDDDDLPDTQMGRMLRSHLTGIRNGQFPTLRMFARQGHKYLEFEKNDYFNNPDLFYPIIPDTHQPGFAGKQRKGEEIDYSIEATEWLEDRAM